MAKTTLTGANQVTDWYDLRAAASSVCFTLTGDFADAVGVQYSNTATGTDYTQDATTYSTKAGPLEIPFGTCQFVRFYSGNSWSAGKSCSVSWAKAKDPNGQLVDVLPQSTVGQGT